MLAKTINDVNRKISHNTAYTIVKQNITTVHVYDLVYAREHIPRGRNYLDENQWASCVRSNNCNSSQAAATMLQRTEIVCLPRTSVSRCK